LMSRSVWPVRRSSGDKSIPQLRARAQAKARNQTVAACNRGQAL
jgi:hypothetical protein